MKQRDLSIDYLRFIGISMIILAHVAAPFSLVQFRSFDVPLMIFISGLTSSRKTFPNYFRYIWTRSKRLLVPVYIFLTALFIIMYLLRSSGVIIENLSLKTVVHTYLLLEGIGYVWIIRVFLLIMILTPFLVRFEMTCKSNVLYGLACLALMLLNDAILLLQFPLPGGKLLNIFVGEFAMYLIGYVPLFMLGLRMRYSDEKVCRRYIWGVSVCAASGVLCYLANNGLPLAPSAYKYPPQFYFLVYGSLVSVILWCFRDKIANLIDFLKLTSAVTFIGQNTIWIYLWHIPFVMLFKETIDNWFLRYAVIYGCALAVFKLQTLLVRRIAQHNVNKYFLG